MSSVSATRAAQRFVLQGVSWESYEKLLEAFPEHRLRHAYDGWTLEIMSPSQKHDRTKKLIGRFVEALSLELSIPIKSIGSTTLRGVEVKKGLEPDETYFVANEARVRGKEDFDPEQDPPPDLAIEVEVSRSIVKRMPLFALIGVPEVWRYRKGELQFYRRNDAGRYDVAENSLAFPFLRPGDITHFLHQCGTIDETSVIKKFMAWVREQSNPAT